MDTPYDIDAELAANRIADRVVKGGVLVEAIENVVEVKIKESYKSREFTGAVGSIVESKVTQVFDNHMGELGKAIDAIKKEISAINNRLTELEKK